MANKDWKAEFTSLRKKLEANPLYGKLMPFLSNLGKWQSQTTGQLVGLDIGRHDIKLLKLNKIDEGHYQVEYFATAQLPEGAVSNEEIKDAAAVSAVVRDMFLQSGLSSKQVALAIPRSLAIIKQITIDERLNAEEIESRAWIEAQRHFPELVGDIYLDFAVKPSAKDGSGQLELELVACRKEHINPYLDIARMGGVTAKVLDVDCYALERALSMLIQPEKDQVTALFNINVNLSTLIVVQNKRMIYSHDQVFDGQRLMKQFAEFKESNSFDFNVSDELILANEQYNTFLKDNLISHLRHTVHFFYSSKANIVIDQLILAGDCARIPAIALFVEREVGIKTSVADPSDKLILSPDIDEQEFKVKSPALMLCCGLAMSELPV